MNIPYDVFPREVEQFVSRMVEVDEVVIPRDKYAPILNLSLTKFIELTGRRDMLLFTLKMLMIVTRLSSTLMADTSKIDKLGKLSLNHLKKDVYLIIESSRHSKLPKILRGN